MELGFNLMHICVYGKTQPKSFFSDVNVNVNVKAITVSQIFCELLHFEMLVF
jgi:hypothetical protein